MIATKPRTKDLAALFAHAASDNNLEVISALLSENGTFDIQTPDLETLEVGKHQFLSWFTNKLSETKITSIQYDQCMHCHIGNPVVLFNEGQFPRKIKDSSERSKTGILIESESDLITILKFCYLFLVTDNKYDFECRHR